MCIIRPILQTLAATMALGCAAATAQDLPKGPYSSSVHRSTSGGKLIACSVNFTSLVKDDANNRGRPVAVLGSFGLFTFTEPGRGLGMLLKVGLLNSVGTGSGETSPPNYAFLSAGGRTTAGKPLHIQAADTQGYRVFRGEIDSELAEMFLIIADTGKFSVSYNRSPDGVDTEASGDLGIADTRIVGGRVVRTPAPDAVKNWNGCISELANQR